MTFHFPPLLRLVVLAVLVACPIGFALADPFQLYAAGSLREAMQALVKESGLPEGSFAKPVFGPAGSLRERLEKGEQADLFASADMAQPEKLKREKPDVLVVPFARNRMCAIAKSSLGLTPENLVDRWLSSDVRIATSMPGADPGGDYAMAVFDRAEALHPGAAALLKAKALHPFGPQGIKPLLGHGPAESLFLGDHADALISYCSGTPALLAGVPGLVSIPLPESLEVHPVYGFAVLSRDPAAERFALFVLSDAGQAILQKHGFLPLDGAGPKTENP
ncbi:substrate-binding domain-containing protein [Methyloferula stellata]|uniref:substrate-binding domain-containing protein n=1 Tax=Methyloferula stellata TaxID=876270 RepID=UPI00037F096B|nr:substrate-binding domain-containing protein [Methyloferula stellata]